MQSQLDVPLDLATLPEIERAMTKLRLRYGPSTLIKVKAATRALMRYVGRDDIANMIHFRNAKWMPPIRALSPDELDCVLECAEPLARTMILTSTRPVAGWANWPVCKAGESRAQASSR